MFPSLHTLAWISLAVGFLSFAIIGVDTLVGHRQHMRIMNLVWPITGLYAGPLALAGYFTAGRGATHQAMMAAKARGHGHAAPHKPLWKSAALAATHCGAGCTLGDIIAEWLIVLFPILGAMIFHTRMFNAWIVDFLLAYLIGIVFQYFTIAPMRHLSIGKGIIAALKADTLSLIAWQIGMYGWMALAVFCFFHREIPTTGPVFWFMMQIAMLCGFATSYPVNAWLVHAGMKEAM